ncbi:regulator of chromosome condensation RCC1 [Kribbella flavida DSM 17836]|uniref:Regulator of chromosome condensation RCC1 n=1 Tax=Kribbella flavida (strain DSM 17836 / JCM 10339 / NBRC 14399) TaxID=479435 RepID=D2PYZ7_KRIFD|nr:regulator of chromosome condensation RCC1 [Kribbella flavida]ADB31791.1 regulator of chromosome condensation RCC1 [Kribbella flavida DSM 17836]
MKTFRPVLRALGPRALHRPVLLVVALTAAAGIGACAKAQPLAAPTAAGPSNTGGLVLSTGFSDAGQLGRSAPTGIRTSFGPVVDRTGANLVGVVALAAGEQHSLALLNDGRVLAWGANDDGQLGTGTRAASVVPLPVRAPDNTPGALTGVVDIAADSNTSVALRKDGTVVVWGRANSGQRGNADTTANPTTPSVVLNPSGTGPLTGVRAISVDGGSELALTDRGTVLGWGDNTFGQLGTSAPPVAKLPVAITGQGKVPLGNVRAIAIGGQHSVALLGDGRVMTWGRNDVNQLGDGTGVKRNFPAPVLIGPGQPLTGATEISSAEKYTLALLKDGSVVGWGHNNAGQLGNGTVKVQPFASPVRGRGDEPKLLAVKHVFAGESYSVAVLQNGTILTWGANGRGQLASGDRADRSKPGPVSVENGVPAPNWVTAVAVGRRHLLITLR